MAGPPCEEPDGVAAPWGLEHVEQEGRGLEPQELVLRVGKMSHAEPREAATAGLGHRALPQAVRI